VTARGADRTYVCEVAPVARLGDADRAAMAALYGAVYDGSSRELFLADLAAKDEVLLLRSEGEILGFTTLQTYGRHWNGQRLRVLYSGDTVVHPDHWGQQALSFAWVRHLAALKQRHHGERLVWFLLVKGHRTYRYLHVFARGFFPGQAPAGSDLAALADWLARDRFPQDYNPATGLVEFRPSRGHLRGEYAQPRAEELGRAGVAEFLDRNPAYRQGHELACVCDIDEGNMKPLTLRLFRQGLHAPA
jgi:hypothetical protein